MGLITINQNHNLSLTFTKLLVLPKPTHTQDSGCVLNLIIQCPVIVLRFACLSSILISFEFSQVHMREKKILVNIFRQRLHLVRWCNWENYLVVYINIIFRRQGWCNHIAHWTLGHFSSCSHSPYLQHHCLEHTARGLIGFSLFKCLTDLQKCCCSFIHVLVEMSWHLSYVWSVSVVF